MEPISTIPPCYECANKFWCNGSLLALYEFDLKIEIAADIKRIIITYIDKEAYYNIWRTKVVIQIYTII